MLSAAASVLGVAVFLCIMVAARAQAPPRHVAAWLCAAGAILQASLLSIAPKFCLPCLGVGLCFLLSAKMLPRLPVAESRPQRSHAWPVFAGAALACSVALQAASLPYWPVPTGGRPIAEYRGKEATELVGGLPEGAPGSFCWSCRGARHANVRCRG